MKGIASKNGFNSLRMPVKGLLSFYTEEKKSISIEKGCLSLQNDKKGRNGIVF